jgi:hypothetical protein
VIYPSEVVDELGCVGSAGGVLSLFIIQPHGVADCTCISIEFPNGHTWDLDGDDARQLGEALIAAQARLTELLAEIAAKEQEHEEEETAESDLIPGERELAAALALRARLQSESAATPSTEGEVDE